MEKTIFKIQSVHQLRSVAEYLLDIMDSGPKLVLLYGDLGAGKTTLVKLLAKMLGSTDDTSSPTYALVNEYEVTDDVLYHIDLYRINDSHEAVDMGIEEYIFSESFCFVEWPQVIEHIVDDYIKIDIQLDELNYRSFTIEVIAG